MSAIIKYLYFLVENTYNAHWDPRLGHLPLVGNLLNVLLIIAAYLAFVLYFGPKWMENRKPFELKRVMQIYNAVQVLANASLFIIGIKNSYFRKDFSLSCQGVDNTNTEAWMLKLVYATYGYYLTKYLDLLDTVFFILRKKNSQVTFLHVYHHAGMILGVHIHTTFLSGSHSTLLGVINLFVHTVMYAYYFITSVRPIKRTLWWKRHITQLQLIQFGYLFIHYLVPILNNHCHHPVNVLFVGLIQNLFMFALFFDFYYKAYLKKKPEIVNVKSVSKEIQSKIDESKIVSMTKVHSD